MLLDPAKSFLVVASEVAVSTSSSAQARSVEIQVARAINPNFAMVSAPNVPSTPTTQQAKCVVPASGIVTPLKSAPVSVAIALAITLNPTTRSVVSA
jgi:hypothetical protein